MITLKGIKGGISRYKHVYKNTTKNLKMMIDRGVIVPLTGKTQRAFANKLYYHTRRSISYDKKRIKCG